MTTLLGNKQSDQYEKLPEEGSKEALHIFESEYKGELVIDKNLEKFIRETASGVKISGDKIIKSLEKIVKQFAGENKNFLEKRQNFQDRIDEYLDKNKDNFDKEKYYDFLKEIGYIEKEGKAEFELKTENVDPEISDIAAPQLVCPVFNGQDPASNARFPLNAANARWGSLYDALYGKKGDRNIIEVKDQTAFDKGYNKDRGKEVIKYANNNFLDKIFPLRGGKKHSDVTSYYVEGNQLVVKLEDGSSPILKNPEKFVGFKGSEESPTSILLKNNGLHVELQIDKNHNVDQDSKAGVKDIILESAVTTIIDLEDSACAVDAEDKLLAYNNVVGLLKGDLQAGFNKGGKEHIRRLKENKKFQKPNGKDEITLPARAVMMFRSAGKHLYTDAVKYKGKEIPESFLDIMMIALAAKYDLEKEEGAPRNSRTKSAYIVMPKMHSASEVAATAKVFAAVEKALDLPNKFLKMGIMDEEQRLSLNLKAAIGAADGRAIFINTGFLDRTGSLMHTAMNLGPVDLKSNIAANDWKKAYEENNVQVGIESGLVKVGQIGKGMWAKNKDMKGLLASKHNHPQAGADVAWVPGPSAATIHALHYHANNVKEIQQNIINSGNKKIDQARILEFPRLPDNISKEKIQDELDGSIQSILGYVVRWIDQGIGCSAIPDKDGTYLMEDRATLRINSQQVAGWLKHGIVTKDQTLASFKEMAKNVDEQNAKDKNYTKLSNNTNGPAFQASLALVFEGVQSKQGYVDDLLKQNRLKAKCKPFKGGDDVEYNKQPEREGDHNKNIKPVTIIGEAKVENIAEQQKEKNKNSCPPCCVVL